MKLLLVMLIIGGFGSAGYVYKRRLDQKYKFLCFIIEFVSYYNSGISLFKNNVVDMIEEFVRQHHGSKFCEIFQKQNLIYTFDKHKIENFLGCDLQETSVVCEYLCGLGKNEYEFEKEKNLQAEKLLSVCKEKSKSNLETKGSLYFKFALLIGAMLCIIIW